jgi:hypothetical protein
MPQPPVTLTRRRYGRMTYTWAEVELDGQRVSLGDPWPGVTWPKAALAEAIADARRLQRGETNGSHHPTLDQSV